MSRKPRIWVSTCGTSTRFISAPPSCSGLSRDAALEEEHGDERVDGQRLGESGNDDHGELNLAGRLGLTPDRLHGAVADAAQPDARADRRKPDPDRKSPTQCRMEIHRRPPFLVSERVALPLRARDRRAGA